MIEDLEEETGAPTARAVRASLSACYSRALERSRLPDTFSSPVVKAYRPQGRRSRERVLTPDELRLIWRAIITYGETFGPIAQLLLLTGQRREEIGGLARAELDLTNNRLDFPSSRTKNNLPHLVPLAEPALEILRAWDRDAADDERERLFGRGEGGFSGWSKAMTRLHIRIARARAERVGDTIEIPAEIQARLDE